MKVSFVDAKSQIFSTVSPGIHWTSCYAESQKTDLYLAQKETTEIQSVSVGKQEWNDERC